MKTFLLGFVLVAIIVAVSSLSSPIEPKTADVDAGQLRGIVDDWIPLERSTREKRTWCDQSLCNNSCLKYTRMLVDYASGNFAHVLEVKLQYYFIKNYIFYDYELTL